MGSTHICLVSVTIYESADVVNAVLYLTEGTVGNAALSGICAFPLLGDFLGKAGKETKYLLKLTDLSKLKRNEKVFDTLKRLDIFFKARRADISDLHKWIRKSWDDLLGGGGYAAEYVTPDGMIYRIRTSDDFRVNINLMDDAGDMLQAGRKVGNAGGLAVKGDTYVLPNAEKLKMSQTVQNHMNDVIKKGPNAGQLSRPYIDSDGTTLLLNEIMQSADPVSDTIMQSGLRWDVSGTFRGSTGIWELVVDTSTNTVVHYNFVAQ